MPVVLLTLLKLYLIAGEMLLVMCLAPDGDAAAELRQVRSFPVVVAVAIVTVLTWPLAFVVVGRR